MFKTGYFANTKRASKVHVVFPDNETICGQRFKPSMHFKWCANGIHKPYVDCVRCLGTLNSKRWAERFK